jgi:hypothetical protein
MDQKHAFEMAYSENQMLPNMEAKENFRKRNHKTGTLLARPLSTFLEIEMAVSEGAKKSLGLTGFYWLG